MKNLARMSLLVAMFFSAGCQADTGNAAIPAEDITSTTLTPASVSADEPLATPDRTTPEQTKEPERVPTDAAVTPVTGEAPPELLDQIVNDLSRRTGVSSAQIVVVQDQQVEWNDGSLGCPKAGEFYTQAIVPGYWILLEAAGTQYDYRAGSGGSFLLCERGIPPLPPSTPNS
jgi:hypothetical protein